MSSDYPNLRNAKFNDRVDRSPAHVPILNLICPAHSFTFRQHSDAEPKPVVPSKQHVTLIYSERRFICISYLRKAKFNVVQPVCNGTARNLNSFLL